MEEQPIVSTPEPFLVDGEHLYLRRHDGMRFFGFDGNMNEVVRTVSPKKCVSMITGLLVQPDEGAGHGRLFIDFETEGLNTNKDRVLTCAVISSSQTYNSFHWYINQPYPNSSSSAIKVHQILNNDWRILYSPHTEKELIEKIVSLIPIDPEYFTDIVAHNGFSFDFKLLLDMASRHGIVFPSNVIFTDTLVMSRKNQKGRHNLKDACQTACIPMPDMEDLKNAFPSDETEGYDLERIADERATTVDILKMHMANASFSFHAAPFDTFMCGQLYYRLAIDE